MERNMLSLAIHAYRPVNDTSCMAFIAMKRVNTNQYW